MRIAVVGDLHHYRIRLRPQQLLGRRIVGQTNLWINRRFAFEHSLLQPVIDQVAAMRPDHIFLTGDVTTTSLEDEFHDVVRFLKPLSDQFNVTLVPGNHDRYTNGARRRRVVEAIMEHMLPKKFPHFEKLTERWHLLALDAAKPALVLSQGRLGESQMSEAAEHIATLRDDEGLVVLCHYPVVWPANAPPIPWNTRLQDGRLLRRAIANCRAKVLYVHGHIHRPWFFSPDRGPMDAVMCLNSGAPCLPLSKYPAGQGFWEIELPDEPADGPRVVHHYPVLNGHKARRRGGNKLLRQQIDQLAWVKESYAEAREAAAAV